ncbi:hypothetical protein [Pedobacter sp. SYP-B3415]|uniref:hypothetical protein n=1 Tax=Pedobacter sp. SYP-B3415 TaxID=2496641 RepID=UPI0013EDC708|nr:hypothetical protein [Pedobacter sp. SYP-B3415]
MKRIQLTGYELRKAETTPLRLVKTDAKVPPRVRMLGRIERLTSYQAKNGLRSLL